MRHRLALVGLALCACGASVTHAQDEADDADAADADVKASLSSVAYYSDNYYNQPAGETAGYGTLINPALAVRKQGAKLQLLGTVDAEYGMFNLPGSQDDYLDGSLQLGLVTQPTLRNQLRLDGGFRHGHDAFGVDRTEDATVRDAELDRWNRVQGALHYRYGAPGARLNADVGVGTLEKRYVTNRGATEPLDYESTKFDYTLFYNYSAKTSALADFSRSDFSFGRSFGVTDTRGGELYRVRGGVKWLATGKTSGDVRAGYRRRTFDAGTPDIEGFDWEAGVDWAPVPRSMLRFEAARSEQESYTADARVIDIRSTRLDWRYGLSSRTRSTVGVEYIEADFDTSDRRDEIYGGTVGLQHMLRRLIWVVGSVGATTRDSTVTGREYDRLNAFVGLRLGPP